MHTEKNAADRYFRHIDGGLYRFIAAARSADTAGPVVVYEHLWPFERGWWVRDRGEFEARFASIEEAEVEAEMKTDRRQAQLKVAAAKTARRAAKRQTFP